MFVQFHHLRLVHPKEKSIDDCGINNQLLTASIRLFRSRINSARRSSIAFFY